MAVPGHQRPVPGPAQAVRPSRDVERRNPLGGRRVVAHPALPRTEPDLNPGVRVGLANQHLVSGGRRGAAAVAADHARGHAEGAQQHHHRPGEVLAVPGAADQQEPAHRVRLPAPRRDVEGVAVVRLQVGDHGLGALAGAAEGADYLARQRRHALIAARNVEVAGRRRLAPGHVVPGHPHPVPQRAVQPTAQQQPSCGIHPYLGRHLHSDRILGHEQVALWVQQLDAELIGSGQATPVGREPDPIATDLGWP